ncbi:hypothetical protein SRB5_30500 [Streptomyces sp. RB5]|uniref:DUF3093 domain-containing protein n=1 Tax=Streptomyces smaragdinus TaxID=2585196 RepID=A0A7K0CHF2_9ACTN|nr:DUF3093 domain-containing protein [Streptomyces smaragdinus]MQY12911.1 hypothetical protein [Streptomyces smaragdinus]
MESYDERLSAPRTWWVVAALVGLSLGLIFLPFGVLASLAAIVCGVAVAAVCVSAYGSARIRIAGDSLVTPTARIPLTALGPAEALDGAAARDWRTHRADTRAYMLLRSYIPTAVRIPVVDPQDPTPYLYLSTRSPQRLVKALDSVRPAD